MTQGTPGIPDTAATPKVERTGNIFSIASSEFRVTYPDGHIGSVWSPPWHNMPPEEEEAAAVRYAKELFAEGRHRDEWVPPTNTPITERFGQ
jgi:hypothetical protein